MDPGLPKEGWEQLFFALFWMGWAFVFGVCIVRSNKRTVTTLHNVATLHNVTTLHNRGYSSQPLSSWVHLNVRCVRVFEGGQANQT